MAIQCGNSMCPWFLHLDHNSGCKSKTLNIFSSAKSTNIHTQCLYKNYESSERHNTRIIAEKLCSFSSGSNWRRLDRKKTLPLFISLAFLGSIVFCVKEMVSVHWPLHWIEENVFRIRPIIRSYFHTFRFCLKLSVVWSSMCTFLLPIVDKLWLKRQCIMGVTEYVWATKCIFCL